MVSEMTSSRRSPIGPAVLFCPGDRPERYAKATAAADVVILDLEDAVAPARKHVARRHVAQAVAHMDPDRTVVRINPPETAAGHADLATLADTPARYLMLPKAQSPEAILALAPRQVIAICETAAGVLGAQQLAATPGCAALVWGGEDLTADLGGRSSRDRNGEYLPHISHARCTILLAAGAARIAAWDGVYLHIDDVAGLARESEQAVHMGFTAKLAIHPKQTPVIRRAFVPAPRDLEWAAELLESHARTGGGVFSFRGRMVDGPLIAQAEAIVAAARSVRPADDRRAPDVPLRDDG